jgi:hypothetical protein
MKIGNSLIKARADTVAEKPAFRSAFKRRRCLVPADGIYEWKATGTKVKQPYFIRMKDGEPFAFAGLWEEWRAPEGEEVQSCSIITTDPNELMKPIPTACQRSSVQTTTPRGLTGRAAGHFEGFTSSLRPRTNVGLSGKYVCESAINQGPKGIEPLELKASPA